MFSLIDYKERFYGRFNTSMSRRNGWTPIIERLPFSHEALSLGAWLLAILSSELAIHGVGEPFRSVMALFLIFTGMIALLAGRRYQNSRLPHWLMASFAATLITLNGFQYAYLGLGITLHEVHIASDMAALATSFFLIVESFTPGIEANKTASLAGFLACCGFLIIIPALLFGLGPISLETLLTLINTEGTADVLSVPTWVPFVGLVPAVVGLYLGNIWLQQETRGDTASEGTNCATT